MDFTCETAKRLNMTPFDFMAQEKDRVIMLINYFIEKGNNEVGKSETITSNRGTETRIRVNDKTATGGWY